jgi:hypothetical protein
MKVLSTLVAATLVATAGVASAGDFQALPTTGALVTGTNNPNRDRLYVEATNIVFDPSDDQAPVSIDYRAFVNSTPFATIATGTLTRIAYRFTEDIELDGEEIGHLYDFVFQDSRDGKLVFGMRTRLGVEDDHDDDSELNFLYRYGMTEGTTVFAPSAAWLFVSDSDLRAYSAGSTDSDALTGATPYDADTVRFQSDINLEEGNPDSGLFLVKTDAMFYRTVDRAIGVFQAGEEGQPRVGSDFAGFAPSAVPEPSTYALMGLGLVGVAAVARRRTRRA